MEINFTFDRPEDGPKSGPITVGWFLTSDKAAVLFDPPERVLFLSFIHILFVVRNVANLVPPYETTGRYHGTSAALEFAVCNLQVENIIVLGHSRCGGIRALLDGYGQNDEGEGFIAPWVQIAAPAREEVLRRWPDAGREFQQRACERAGTVSYTHLDVYKRQPLIWSAILRRR